MKKILFVFLISFPALAKPLCTKTLITANKTDMKAELKKEKKKGRKPVGKLKFKDYSFQQRLVKKCG